MYYCFISQAKTTVSAQAVVAGQVIYTITSVDPEKDQVQYTMTSSSATPPFTINQNSKFNKYKQ